jgi:hypothetical protein
MPIPSDLPVSQVYLSKWSDEDVHKALEQRTLLRMTCEGLARSCVTPAVVSWSRFSPARSRLDADDRTLPWLQAEHRATCERSVCLSRARCRFLLKDLECKRLYEFLRRTESVWIFSRAIRVQRFAQIRGFSVLCVLKNQQVPCFQSG